MSGEKSPEDEPLYTPAETAQRRGMSLALLMEHVRAATIRYVDTGAGKLRKRRRYTPYMIAQFLLKQKTKEVPACPSTKTPDLHFTPTISKPGAVDFAALQKLKAGKKPKP